jgi:hypothetical protein
MRYLKTYKIFEFNDYSEFYELFQELQDNLFQVHISEISSRRLDFSKSDVIDVNYQNLNERPITDEIIKLTRVEIEKTNKKSFGLFLYVGLVPFYIEEIIQSLKFVESFAKEQFGLQIEYLHINKYPRYLYYKSIDSLPKNMEINRLQISFSKI